MDPFGKTMLLTTLHWPDEIRSTGELDLPEEDFDFKPAELQMARQLVSAMTGEFDPERYKDEYREALLQVIEQKVEGKEITEPEPVEESGNLIDLMAALEASVNAAKQARGGEKPVSVKEAKKARSERPARAKEAAEAEKKPARRAARAARGKEAEEELEEAKPARRRKSA
jgi:DNA end-binding protein Ku